jgi:hypothetical protein
MRGAGGGMKSAQRARESENLRPDVDVLISPRLPFLIGGRLPPICQGGKGMTIRILVLDCKFHIKLKNFLTNLFALLTYPGPRWDGGQKASAYGKGWPWTP